MRWCTRKLFKYENMILIIRDCSDATAIQQVLVRLDLKGAPQVAFWSWQSSRRIPNTFLNMKFTVTGASLPLFCCLSPRPLIKSGTSSWRLVLSGGRGGSCSEPITIQNGFSRTEKNSCLHYLNASPFPAPLIGSLITGRGARWLIRNRLLVK